MGIMKNLVSSLAALAVMASTASAVHVECGITTCGNYGTCNAGGSGAGVILLASVDGNAVIRQREGVCAEELYPDCEGEDFGNGLVMYVCTNNPFNIVGGGYCEYNGQRFDFKESAAPTENCQNSYPEYGPYTSSSANALQNNAGHDY